MTRGTAASAGPTRQRASWHGRANAVVAAYLVAAITAAPVHALGAAPRWLAIHLFLLGAVTNAIVVWTGHFTATLLHVPVASRRLLIGQLIALNGAILAVLVGVTAHLSYLTVAGAAPLGAVVALHLALLVRSGWRALDGRFSWPVRFYSAASVALLVGIGLGSALAVGVPDQWQARVYAAHVHANVLGWVALAVLGTEFTLWPVMLRTRMVDGVAVSAKRALVLTATGLAVTLAGLLTANGSMTAIGLSGYIAGVLCALGPFTRTARRKAPRSPGTWMVAAGTTWLAVVLCADLADTLSEPVQRAATSLAYLVPALVAGFVAQVLLGALTYLVPVVLGRGPAGGRRTAAVLDRFGAVRVIALNAGVVLLVLPLPQPFTDVGWAVVLVAIAAFLALGMTALLTTRRNPVPDRTSTSPRGDRRPLLGGIALGVAMLLVGVGIAVTGHSSSSAVEPQAAASTHGSTGRQVVAITLADMDIKPARITIRSGSRLVLDVTNRDFTRHDLAFPGGPRTPMLGPGNSARLDLGTVTRSRTGWCTVPGHKAAGMILTIAVTAAQSSHMGMPTMKSTDAAGKSSAHDARLDPAARPPATFHARDADLLAVPPGRVHHVTLRAVDRTLDVAPGVRQRMWTFNGTVPGPILHGRVGDTFVVTLINESSMGHSIDFHAGVGAPDTMMRTIAPGQRLTYRFTAEHAGAWMYHCATQPMIDHIGNGMYGAVIIDPPHLSAADHQWVVVQSELYFGPQGQHGDFAKMAAGTPDAVVFNGYANQYDYAPLHAHVGDRVRIWVVDAGLARPTAFHIVGTQFDTVFKEGAYLVRRHNAQDGAAQALDLQPGEGGFVETTLPAAGHYPVIDHVMVDAARGAHGSITVSR